MNITFGNVVALQYTDTDPIELPTTHEDAMLTVETGKTYKVNVRIDSNKEFHSIGFDLGWDEENIKPIMSTGAVVTEDGDLFTGLNYDLVANAFLNEKRIYITKSLRATVPPASVGNFWILSILITKTGDRLHLTITTEEVV